MRVDAACVTSLETAKVNTVCSVTIIYGQATCVVDLTCAIHYETFTVFIVSHIIKLEFVM